jgi:hypothetical protein
MGRSRIASLAIVAVGLALVMIFARKMPHEQTVRVILGDRAPRVTEVHVRYSEPPTRREKETAEPLPWLREASFRYAPGSAPRIVSHEARLSDGDYVLEIDVLEGDKQATIERRATLSGGTTSLDVSQAIPK